MTDLDWLKGLRERATEGPWTVVIYPARACVMARMTSAAASGHPDGRPDEENARAIAAAMNLLGPLLALAESADGWSRTSIRSEAEELASMDLMMALSIVRDHIKAERQRQELPPPP